MNPREALLRAGFFRLLILLIIHYAGPAACTPNHDGTRSDIERGDRTLALVDPTRH